jgi:hypothetical protein
MAESRPFATDKIALAMFCYVGRVAVVKNAGSA